MTKAKQGGRSPLKAFTIIVAIIAVILFVSAGVQINEHSQGYARDYDARDYIYSAERGRFSDLYSTALHDMDKHAKYSSEVTECRTLAFYYEQAVLEHAYREAGNNEKADKFAERMKEYETQLGSLASKTALVKETVEKKV